MSLPEEVPDDNHRRKAGKTVDRLKFRQPPYHNPLFLEWRRVPLPELLAGLRKMSKADTGKCER